jgi:acetolactate synthase I/II/III large subunit
MAEGYRIICAALQELGVDTIFGVMGEGNMPLIEEWVHGLGHTYVAARHESGATSMAEGYARAGERIGVATVTQGPGVTNTVTALTSAARQHAPVLLLAGDLPTQGSPSAQNIDHKAVVAPTGAGYHRLGSTHSAHAELYAALHAVQVERRPILLDVPIDLQEMDWPRSDDGPRNVGALTQRPEPDPAGLTEALALLAAASRPVIVAGKGAARAGAREAVVSLAEHLGAPLATTLQAKGLFHGHPLDVGIAGGFAHGYAQTLLGNGDVLLAVGASMNTWTAQHGAAFPEAKVIHIDHDPVRIGSYTDPAVPIVGDARVASEALLARVQQELPADPQRRDKVASTIATGREETRAAITTEGPLTAGEHVIGAVEAILPADRNLVLDAGHFMGWPILHLSVPDPQSFLWTCDFGSIGLGVATGIGAALARPDRTTVIVAGDGGLMLSLGELETVARLGLPVIVLVLNDGGYGAEVQILRSQQRHGELALFDNPDLLAVAGALGFQTVGLRTTDDLDELAKRVANLDGPLFVEARIDDTIAAWFQHMLP